MKKLVCGAVMICLCGCATVADRMFIESGDSNNQGLYPATKLDLCMLAYVPKDWRESDLTDRIQTILEVPFLIIDTPISITFDTVLLPYDIWRNLE